MFNHSQILAVILLGLPLATQASSAEDIAKMSEESAVLAARLNVLEMRAKVLAKEVEIGRLGTPTTGLTTTMTTTSGSSSGAGGAAATPVPTLTAIEGVDGNLSAMLTTSSGVSRVRPGGRVGEWTVSAIEPDAVTVSRKVSGRRAPEVVRLGLSVESLQASSAGASMKTSLPLPPVPYPSR